MRRSIVKYYDVELIIVIIVQQGHENFVSQLDWSRDGRYLQSVSGDYDLIVCKCCIYLWFVMQLGTTSVCEAHFYPKFMSKW